MSIETEAEPTPLHFFIEENGLTATAKPTDSNPSWGGGTDAVFNHWLVTIHFDGGTFVTTFSQGEAITTDPDVVNVLWCLALDAETLHQDFWDYVEEWGIEPSREAESSFKAGQAQSEALKNFLGWDRFEALLSAASESDL